MQRQASKPTPVQPMTAWAVVYEGALGATVKVRVAPGRALYNSDMLLYQDLLQCHNPNSLFDVLTKHRAHIFITPRSRRRVELHAVSGATVDAQVYTGNYIIKIALTRLDVELVGKLKEVIHIPKAIPARCSGEVSKILNRVGHDVQLSLRKIRGVIFKSTDLMEVEEEVSGMPGYIAFILENYTINVKEA